MRAFVSVTLLAVALLAPRPSAGAEVSPANAALAQSLFEEGRTLMQDERYDLACDRFAESQRLDPSGGTLLNLAVCHEKQGRIATAYVEFNDALSLAIRDGRKDREVLARDRIAELGPTLPRLQVSLASAPLPGLELSLDGSPLATAAALPGAPSLRVDPGAHRIAASAPDHETRVVEVVAARGATPVGVVLPALAPSPATLARPLSAPPRAPASASSGTRTAGWVTGGLGVAAVAVGAGFGVGALVEQHAANEACPTSHCGDAGAVKESDQATTSAWVADVAIGAGLVAVGVGVYLVLKSSPTSHVQVVGRGLELRF